MIFVGFLIGAALVYVLAAKGIIKPGQGKGPAGSVGGGGNSAQPK